MNKNDTFDKVEGNLNLLKLNLNTAYSNGLVYEFQK